MEREHGVEKCKRSDAAAELSQTINGISHGQFGKGDSNNGNSSGPSGSAQQGTRKPVRVPHFLCETTCSKDRFYRFLYGLSVFINVLYFALRIFYIITGKVKVSKPSNASEGTLAQIERQNNVALLYSTIVLVAEFGGFVLVHVGQQMFFRQKTKFTKMNVDNVERMDHVRSRAHLSVFSFLRSLFLACDATAAWLCVSAFAH
jgi:hydrogenase maturation factor